MGCLAGGYRDLRASWTPRPVGTQAGQEVAVTTDKSGRTSAGILLWRRRDDRLEVLLAHMGGPYWVNKDLGHWTIPKARSRRERNRWRSLAESSRRKPDTSSPTPR